MRVSGKNILGEPSQAWVILKNLQERAAVAKCAEMVGGLQAAFDMTVAYAKEREQFGRAIGSFQAIQHHCANMAVDVYGSRHITYLAAWRIKEGLPFTKDVSTAKAWVSDAYQRTVALGTQAHGGVSIIEDHDMPLYFRRAKAGELAFGDAGFHRKTVARKLGFKIA